MKPQIQCVPTQWEPGFAAAVRLSLRRLSLRRGGGLQLAAVPAV